MIWSNAMACGPWEWRDGAGNAWCHKCGAWRGHPCGDIHEAYRRTALRHKRVGDAIGLIATVVLLAATCFVAKSLGLFG